MKNILFVDDEELVLKGLRRMLHDAAGEWKMVFATGGQAALEQMERTKFDVVVSDMRMPGMNGNRLFAQVKQLYPSTVRIILSGHADLDLILESTLDAHQYLSKPCQEAELRAAIQRCCSLRSLLDDDVLVDIVTNLSCIPSLPALYLEVVEASQDDSKSLNEVGEVIAKDIGMSSKILQLVNSAFFGLPRHIAGMGDAVAFLGINTVKALVLSMKVFSSFEGDGLSQLSLEQVASHNLSTGALARRIAKEAGMPREVADDALLAGSLHDIGKLILALNRSEEFAQVLELIREQRLSMVDAEMQIFGTSHARVGAYLLSLWGLPQSIVEAVAYHHDPQSCSSGGVTALTAVHVANILEAQLDATDEQGTPRIPPELDIDYLDSVGVLDRVPGWIKDCGSDSTEERP